MLDMELFRSRRKEAFGTDTLYHISGTYKVSIDWLLGLSERKRIVKGRLIIRIFIQTWCMMGYTEIERG